MTETEKSFADEFFDLMNRYEAKDSLNETDAQLINHLHRAYLQYDMIKEFHTEGGYKEGFNFENAMKAEDCSFVKKP
jgi:hypothetical protein